MSSVPTTPSSTEETAAVASSTDILFDQPPSEQPSSSPIDQDTSQNSALSPAPQVVTQSALFAQFLVDIGCVSDLIQLETPVQQAIYELCQDNRPHTKAQLFEHTSLKRFKKQQLSEGLDTLVKNGVMVECHPPGVKSVVYYLNPAKQPHVDDKQATKLITYHEQLQEQLNELKNKHIALQTTCTKLRNEPMTTDLETQVDFLENEIENKTAKIAHLRALSSNPEYLGQLKGQFKDAVLEWKKRKAKAYDISDGYLETVSKKRRIFFRELGCETEDMTLKITLKDYMEWGQQIGVFASTSIKPGSGIATLTAVRQQIAQQQQQQIRRAKHQNDPNATTTSVPVVNLPPGTKPIALKLTGYAKPTPTPVTKTTNKTKK